MWRTDSATLNEERLYVFVSRNSQYTLWKKTKQKKKQARDVIFDGNSDFWIIAKIEIFVIEMGFW